MISTSAVSSLAHSSRLLARIALLLLLGAALVVEPAPAQPDPGSDSELSAQGGVKKHRKRQRRPVKMGTSGGNANDFTVSNGFIFCCSGTLGGMVRKGSDYFALSNNHVLAQVNQARAGDRVTQPGFLDTRCDARSGDQVGHLTGYKRMKLRGKNRVDGAIAELDPGTFDDSGSVIGIGVPGNEPISPRVGMEVQKSGRTTGVRKGQITAVGVTVDVEYQDECSDTAGFFSVRFVGQFFVESTSGRSFSAGGDSGSVIFEDVRTCPNPVGLLFAGNSFITAANQMKAVMKAVNKMKPKGDGEFVGCDQKLATGGLTAATAMPGLDERQLRLAERIQARTQKEIFALDGVHAMGIGRSSSNPEAPAFRVYVEPAAAERGARLPRELQGVPVEVIESSRLRALNCAQSPLAR